MHNGEPMLTHSVHHHVIASLYFAPSLPLSLPLQAFGVFGGEFESPQGHANHEQCFGPYQRPDVSEQC